MAEKRILAIYVHCSDLCTVEYPNGKEHDGYVPEGIGIGGGDDLQLEIDIDTGMVVGWSEKIRNAVLKQQDEDEDEDE